MTRREATNFIENHILRSIKNDIGPLYRDRKVFFAIPREIYAYIEYLAKLNDGKDSKIGGVVNFIKTYFPQKNKWYRKIPYILSVMLRHGGFHQLSPKMLKVKGLEVVIILGRGNRADKFKFQGFEFDHLKPRDLLLNNIEFWSHGLKRRVRGNIRALWIPVSVKALYGDFQEAVRNYKKVVFRSSRKLKIFEQGMDLIYSPETEAKLQSRHGFDKSELKALKRLIN